MDYLKVKLSSLRFLPCYQNNLTVSIAFVKHFPPEMMGNAGNACALNSVIKCLEINGRNFEHMFIIVLFFSFCVYCYYV